MKPLNFILLSLGAVVVAVFFIWILFKDSGKIENHPYAIKQNGDTLFIPTQVVVRHDTIVVIKTTDSVRVEDSGYQKVYFDSTGLMRAVYDKKKAGTEITYHYPGGYIISPRPYKQRDTIYEHKIIYY